MLRQINLQDKRLTELESLALSRMLEKREEYVMHGRGREAHGAGTMIFMLWSILTDGRTLYDTGYGGLNE